VRHVLTIQIVRTAEEALSGGLSVETLLRLGLLLLVCKPTRKNFLLLSARIGKKVEGGGDMH